MPTVSDVVRSRTNVHEMLSWRIGTILAVDTTARKLTVQFGGAMPGQGTPGVDYIDGLNPAVNKKVHCLCTETHGILAIGMTGSSTPSLLMAEPATMGLLAASAEETSAPDSPVNSPAAITSSAESDPQYSGTLISGSGGQQFIAGPVRQGEEVIGVWNIPNLAQIIVDAMAAGLVTQMDIELILVLRGPRARLVLLEDRDGSPDITLPPVRSVRLSPGVPTLIPLPLGWLEPLATGQALVGVMADKMTFPAEFDPKATVYLSVQTV